MALAGVSPAGTLVLVFRPLEPRKRKKWSVLFKPPRLWCFMVAFTDWDPRLMAGDRSFPTPTALVSWSGSWPPQL